MIGFVKKVNLLLMIARMYKGTPCARIRVQPYPRCRIGLQGGPLLTKDYQHSENHDCFT